jgi:hypothetical protein
MDSVTLKSAFFTGCKCFCILLLGVIVVLGWLILLLAGVQLLGTYFPVLVPMVTEWQRLMTGCFIAAMHYPLVVFLLLAYGGFLLHRFRWDAWF